MDTDKLLKALDDESNKINRKNSLIILSGL